MDLFNYKNQNIKNHFQRSTRIDNDLTKDFLDHFIFHSTGKKVLNQITSSINNSNQCAFTLTGPYGTGKSSLALFLQALLSNDGKIKKQEFYCVYGNENFTLNELVKHISSILKFNLKTNKGFYSYRDREIMNSVPRYERIPNWSPKFNIEKGINSIINNK